MNRFVDNFPGHFEQPLSSSQPVYHGNPFTVHLVQINLVHSDRVPPLTCHRYNRIQGINSLAVRVGRQPGDLSCIYLDPVSRKIVLDHPVQTVIILKQVAGRTRNIGLVLNQWIHGVGLPA